MREKKGEPATTTRSAAALAVVLTGVVALGCAVGNPGSLLNRDENADDPDPPTARSAKVDAGTLAKRDAATVDDRPATTGGKDGGILVADAGAATGGGTAGGTGGTGGTSGGTTGENLRPTLTGVSPSTLPVGSPEQWVTLTGTGFNPQTTGISCDDVMYRIGKSKWVAYDSATQVRVLFRDVDLAKAGNWVMYVYNHTSETSVIGSVVTVTLVVQ